MSSFAYNKPFINLRYLLQTHSPSDHFDASHLTTRIPEYMGVNTPPLQIYASEKTLKKMSEMMKSEGYVDNLFDDKEQERMNLKVLIAKSFKTFKVGNYEVTSFPIRDKNMQFSIVILDRTYGPGADGKGHLARIYATHISHEGNPNHDGLSLVR